MPNVIIARIKWADVWKEIYADLKHTGVLRKVCFYFPLFKWIYNHTSWDGIIETDRSAFDPYLPNFSSVCFFQRTHSCTTSIHFHADVHLLIGHPPFFALLFALGHWPTWNVLQAPIVFYLYVEFGQWETQQEVWKFIQEFILLAPFLKSATP